MGLPWAGAHHEMVSVLNCAQCSRGGWLTTSRLPEPGACWQPTQIESFFCPLLLTRNIQQASACGVRSWVLQWRVAGATSQEIGCVPVLVNTWSLWVSNQPSKKYVYVFSTMACLDSYFLLSQGLNCPFIFMHLQMGYCLSSPFLS